MAEPVSFPEANLTMAPAGGELQVLSLVGEGPDGEVVSCWEFDFIELAEICRTRKVWVTMRGPVPPGFRVTGLKTGVL